MANKYMYNDLFTLRKKTHDSAFLWTVEFLKDADLKRIKLGDTVYFSANFIMSDAYTNAVEQMNDYSREIDAEIEWRYAYATIEEELRPKSEKPIVVAAVFNIPSYIMARKKERERENVITIVLIIVIVLIILSALLFFQAYKIVKR